MINKSFIEQELERWIKSYNKNTNTYRVLLGKYPNILSLIQKARGELKEKRFRAFGNEMGVVAWEDIEKILGK